ncbi:hypothetical protein LCGC14_1587520 [marine sediment metagenome]|uniref:N-acetylmuramoyl-L-alanine amidase domain-containing protein n=1 Tax=marine sediment metagenome TaxID=412755 RepID=A0A0F9J149_9ZZZZ
MELWFPGVVRRLGPSRKVHGRRNRTTGVVYHSAVGNLDTTFGVLDGSGVTAFHMTNAKDGRMFQHYPLDVLVYHARGGNSWSIGVENEGGPLSNVSEPLTEAQVQNLADLSRWLVEQGWLASITRTGPNKSLWEHREVPGSACESFCLESSQRDEE